MNRFDQTVNTVLRKIDDVTIKEDNEIMVQMKSGKSFGDFLRSLVGKSRKNILDSASFARLYDMNMSVYGGGSKFNNEENPHGLMSKFMTKFGDYVNQGITELRSGAAETDEFKNKYDYQGHLEREKERRDLLRQSMTEKDPEKKAELRQKKNAFRNNSEYAEARRALYKKEDVAVDDYHNRPIEQGELVNDGSDEFKELEISDTLIDKEITKECVALVREKVGPVAAFKLAIVVKRLPKTRSGKVLRGTVRKIADGESYKIPPTIDDPAILEEIKKDLKDHNILKI